MTIREYSSLGEMLDDVLINDPSCGNDLCEIWDERGISVEAVEESYGEEVADAYAKWIYFNQK